MTNDAKPVQLSKPTRGPALEFVPGRGKLIVADPTYEAIVNHARVSRADVVKVPLSALFRQGAQWAVFVEQRGRAALKPVEIGHENGLEAEVLSGVTPGERIVLHPGDRVWPGARLSERK